MSKNNVIIALVVLCLVGTIWGSVQNKKSQNLEKQIASMKGQTPVAGVMATGESATVNNDAVDDALGQVESLKSQNKELLAEVATLKGSVAGLKKEIEEASGDNGAVASMQAELDKSAGAVAKLEETVAALKTELAEKVAALAVAEEAAAGLENVKTTLANSIDAYSEKSQELTTELENAELRVTALETALDERTKLLAANSKELARTKLNMNVLLSRIAAQNNTLAILEETRVALEKELVDTSLIVEELQHQLGAQVVVDAVIGEEMAEEAEATQVEEPAPRQ